MLKNAYLNYNLLAKIDADTTENEQILAGHLKQNNSRFCRPPQDLGRAHFSGQFISAVIKNTSIDLLNFIHERS